MGSLGMQELIVIFVLALIVFGPRKLPELGKTVGKGLAEFKKASNELKQTWEEEVKSKPIKYAIERVKDDIKRAKRKKKKKEEAKKRKVRFDLGPDATRPKPVA